MESCVCISGFQMKGCWSVLVNNDVINYNVILYSLAGEINSLKVDEETLPLFCGVMMMSKVVSPIKLSSIVAHSSHLVIC